VKNLNKWAMSQRFAQVYESPVDPVKNEDSKKETFVQWTTPDDTIFMPANKNVKLLKPGFYEIGQSMQGVYFEKVALATEDLIKFPETSSETVVGEIEKFWTEENKFRQNKLAYKRGILMYGPPGGGKTCTIKMILDNIVKRGGIVLKFDNATLFKAGMRVIRVIQPETPVVALMEDLDSILQYNCESEVINILDGLNGVDKVVYLATTNYPEKLGSRIMNRPSRFDRRYFIGMPNAESRKIYLQHKLKGKDQNIDKWVTDTEGMSVAHLKELVVAVTILENKYEEAVETLREMKNKVNSRAWDELGDGHTLTSAIKAKKTVKVAKEEREKDRLKGGLGDKLKMKDLDPEQLGKGVKVEKEHTDDPGLAAEIAKDHLAEHPADYYDGLEEMEKKLEKKKKASSAENINKCASGWNSPLIPGRFFSTKTALLKVLA